MQSMAYEQENLVQMEQLVEQCLEKRMAQLIAPAQTERLARVEAEFRHQRELMQQGFENMNKRFEAVDKRFEAVDKHFEMLISSIDKRFEAVDKRFEELRYDMNQRFVFMQWLMMAGFGLLSFMITLYKFFP